MAIVHSSRGSSDTAGDADHFGQAIAEMGALAVIPNNPSRALKHPVDKHLYAQRHLIECCFSKLKQFRHVATRFAPSSATPFAPHPFWRPAPRS